MLIRDVPRTINLDVYDYDGDGIPEIAMGLSLSRPAPEKSIGNVLILKSGADPRQPWTAREIDRIPTVHRIRWIDLEGNGKKVLLVAPMIGAKSVPPDYADRVRSTGTGPASGSGSCSRTRPAASCTASRRCTGRGAASNS